jgi:hypothetical protein
MLSTQSWGFTNNIINFLLRLEQNLEMTTRSHKHSENQLEIMQLKTQKMVIDGGMVKRSLVWLSRFVHRKTRLFERTNFLILILCRHKRDENTRGCHHQRNTNSRWRNQQGMLLIKYAVTRHQTTDNGMTNFRLNVRWINLLQRPMTVK